MRFSAVVLAATVSSIALARQLSQRQLGSLPTCAQSCVTGNFDGCQSLDIACICGKASFIAEISCCVSKSCDAADQQATIAFAQQLCLTYSITLPTVAGCTGAAATSSAPAGSSSDSATAAANSASTSASAPPASSSDSGSPSAATTGSRSTSSTEPQASSPSQTSTQTSSPSANSDSGGPQGNSGGVSHTDRIAIGIGVGLGVPLVVFAALAWLCPSPLQRFRSGKSEAVAPPASQPQPEYLGMQQYPGSPQQHQDSYAKPVEMYSPPTEFHSPPRAELPGWQQEGRW